MTGGTVVILGNTGDNFGAGMTGGMAFIYDEDQKFSLRVNPETLLFDTLQTDYWTNELHQHIVKHQDETGSLHAKKILDNWETEKNKFVQICPKEVAPTLEHQLGFKEKLLKVN